MAVPEGDVVNAMYYFADRQSRPRCSAGSHSTVGPRDRSPTYDGYGIIVSDVRATYGDGRLPAPTGTSRASDDTPDQDAGRSIVSTAVSAHNEELA